MPLIGTVDGEYTSQVAGSIGARMPGGMGLEGRRLYAEHVHKIRWYTNEIGGPIKFQHAGTTDRTFVRDMVAPILVGGGVRREAIGSPKPNLRPAASPPQATRPTRSP